MNIDTIFTILFQLFLLGGVFVILWYMFNLVESKVPEPFKQVVSWVRVFTILLCCVWAIYFLMGVAGIGTGSTLIGHSGRL